MKITMAVKNFDILLIYFESQYVIYRGMSMAVSIGREFDAWILDDIFFMSLIFHF